MFKHTIPALFPLITPSLTWKVKTTDKVLYLTFDDGPHPEITPQVLNLLDAYNAKATFFCVGENVSRYPEVFADICHKGHAVGNHTHNHLKGWRTPLRTYLDNTALAALFIPSRLFRPPYGQITPMQIKALRGRYRIVMWSILTRDYERNLNAAQTALKLNRITGPGDVVVFHDSEKAAERMFVMLESMLRHFHQLGYRFLPLS